MFGAVLLALPQQPRPRPRPRFGAATFADGGRALGRERNAEIGLGVRPFEVGFRPLGVAVVRELVREEKFDGALVPKVGGDGVVDGECGGRRWEVRRWKPVGVGMSRLVLPSLLFSFHQCADARALRLDVAEVGVDHARGGRAYTSSSPIISVFLNVRPRMNASGTTSMRSTTASSSSSSISSAARRPQPFSLLVEQTRPVTWLVDGGA